MRRTLPVVAGVLLAVLALSGCGAAKDEGPIVSGITTSDHDGYAGVLLPKPYPLPDTTLRTDAGKAFPFRRATTGHLSIVFFGYTLCPDTCQVVMGTLASAYARLDASEKQQVRVVFVTTDPARDTPKVLRQYLDRLDPSFVGLTGSLDTIDATGKPLGVFIKKGAKLPSGGYEVDHTASVYAVDGHGTAPLVWDGTQSPAQVAGDVQKLLATGAAKEQK